MTPPNLACPPQDHHAAALRGLLADFPVDLPLAMELGGVRLLAVPEISRLLLASEGYARERSARHAVSLGAVIRLLRIGCGSPEGSRLLESIRASHDREQVPADILLYSLALLVCAPLEWLEQFGWRRPTEREREALAGHWSEAARGLNLPAPPATHAEWRSWLSAFELRRHAPAPENRAMAEIARREFAERFPRAARGLAGPLLGALLEESVLHCLALPPASRLARSLIRAAFHARRAALHQAGLRRRGWCAGTWALPALAVEPRPAGEPLADPRAAEA